MSKDYTELANFMDFDGFDEEAVDPCTQIDVVKIYNEQIKKIPLTKSDGYRGHELATRNLRLGAHVARLSMGWVPYGLGRHNLSRHARREVFKGGRVPDLSIFGSAPLPIADRVQETSLGLLRAAENYLPGGYSFRTFSVYYMEHYISRAIKYDKTIKVPVNVLDMLNKVKKKPHLLNEQSFPEMEVPGVDTPQERQEHIERVLAIASLDEIQERSEEIVYERDAEDEEPPTFFEQMPAICRENDGQEMAERQAEDDELYQALNRLNSRQREVINLRFGLTDGQPRTLEEISKVYGVTKERIRQIETDALKKLASFAADSQPDTPSIKEQIDRRVSERVDQLNRLHAGLRLDAVKLLAGATTMKSHEIGKNIWERLDEHKYRDGRVDGILADMHRIGFVLDLYRYNSNAAYQLDSSSNFTHHGRHYVEEGLLRRVEGKFNDSARKKIFEEMRASLRVLINNGSMAVNIASPTNFAQWLERELLFAQSTVKPPRPQSRYITTAY